MPSDEFDAPGLKVRRNKDGTARLYWVARADIRKAGYEPETVRLHYDLHDPRDRLLIEMKCKCLQAEMFAWRAGKRDLQRPFDGTLASLVRLYQTDAASPYRLVKHNTRETYDQVLRLIELAFGKRVLVNLALGDFRRWYDEAKKPKAAGCPERVRKAHGIISMLRRLFAYGTAAEYAGCDRLAGILEATRFKQPKRRRIRMELHHLQAFIPRAIEAGRLSLALGTAIQFETGMRQKDVIGEWEPHEAISEVGDMILLRGKRGRRVLRWVNGLTWADLAGGTVLVKETTKTGAMVANDLANSPLLLDLIERVPLPARVGPLIVDESAGRPYAKHAYAREWRVIARAAGIPDQVWNMDARAGAITEAEDAGADLDQIRGAVGHTQASSTARYSRGALGKSRKVAELPKRAKSRVTVRRIKCHPRDGSLEGGFQGAVTDLNGGSIGALSPPPPKLCHIQPHLLSPFGRRAVSGLIGPMLRACRARRSRCIHLSPALALALHIVGIERLAHRVEAAPDSFGDPAQAQAALSVQATDAG
ncbi:integrase [Aquabacter cavernae]|uniref:integrase n=1 Tax=Aquabacter cavernae TaxID=2496029 RepID=UPI001FE162E5|nr:integrase [Aquabacter cavernae]